MEPVLPVVGHVGGVPRLLQVDLHRAAQVGVVLYHDNVQGFPLLPWYQYTSRFSKKSIRSGHFPEISLLVPLKGFLQKAVLCWPHHNGRS